MIEHSARLRKTTEEDGHESTRRRLLEAAEVIFAEKGFKHANVREICQQAGANVAAVNYHFGGKEQLYIETVRHAYQSLSKGAQLPPGRWIRLRSNACVSLFKRF